MGSRDSCSECGGNLEKHSIVCRHCRHWVREIDPGDKESVRGLLIRSANIAKEPVVAFDACLEYGRRFPNGPAIRDIQITIPVIRVFAAARFASDGKLPEPESPIYDENLQVAGLVGAGLPDVLANGILTRLKVTDNEKRKIGLKVMVTIQAIFADLLLILFEEAQRETMSLMPNGRSQAQSKKMTMEEAYDDAEVYYKAYEEGDLSGALRGFSYLKQLAPKDAYFRNMLGAILSQQGKAREALREFLWGVHLDPGEPRLTMNLMRELTALSLHPAALEVFRHYQRHRQADIAPEIDKQVDSFGGLAATCTAGFVGAFANFTPRDVSEEATDLLEEPIAAERPWLTKPTVPVPEGSKDILEGRRIFISYRRADSAGMAERLQRKLKTQYPSSRIFLDEVFMVGGKDFTNQLREEIDSADAFLLLIGPYWHTEEARAKLSKTNDILHREIARALRNGLAIVPVLVEDTNMPDATFFPEDLRQVARIHARRLRSDSFESDFGALQAALARVITEQELDRQATDEFLERVDKPSPEQLKKIHHELPKLVKAKSQHGEGIPYEQTNLYGIWECVVKGRGKHFTLRIKIEDRFGSAFTGEWIDAGVGGVFSRKREIRGDWAQVFDEEARLFLGLYLDFIIDGSNRMQLTVPFHDWVGDQIIGTDAQGVQYVSRNVEPRAKGF